MTDTKPQSPAELRSGGMPAYIIPNCATCGTALVLSDSLETPPTPSDEVWHDEWKCPKCNDGLRLDVPPNLRLGRLVAGKPQTVTAGGISASARPAASMFRWILIGTVALLGGFAFYEWLLFRRWDNLKDWGALGSAVAPVAAVFSAGAVFAALWSIELQRRSIELQRLTLAGQQGEIDRHMTLLEDQRKEFTRSANAHQDLAKAEHEVATAQQEANKLAERAIASQNEANRMSWFAELAQRRANLATLHSVRTTIAIAVAEMTGEASTRIVAVTKPLKVDTDAQIAKEVERIDSLEASLGLVEKNDSEVEANG